MIQIQNNSWLIKFAETSRLHGMFSDLAIKPAKARFVECEFGFDWFWLGSSF